MPEILIVYASTHGHTARIASRVAAALRYDGLAADAHDVRTMAPAASPADYDGVVVAASIHGGRHQREMVDWVHAHHTSLTLRPSALVSVSLAAAEDGDAARATTREYADELEDETGWTPDARLCVAGALQYREYSAPMRLVLRLIARRHGQSTDTSRDHDYTDWEAVDRFARDFGRRVLMPVS
jgi:menaquinone-dependent protoporphyrinogen oxidase